MVLLCSFLWDQEEFGQALEPGVVEVERALPAFCIQSGLKGVVLAGQGKNGYRVLHFYVILPCFHHPWWYSILIASA